MEMKRNPTAMITLMGWQVGNTRRKAVTSVILSDGETEIPFTEQLHKDLEAFEERIRGEQAERSADITSLRQAG